MVFKTQEDFINTLRGRNNYLKKTVEELRRKKKLDDLYSGAKEFIGAIPSKMKECNDDYILTLQPYILAEIIDENKKWLDSLEYDNKKILIQNSFYVIDEEELEKPFNYTEKNIDVYRRIVSLIYEDYKKMQ